MEADELAVYFWIPAQDQMGYLHVDGKLRFLDDRIVLQFKVRDRVFKKSGNTLEKIEFPYSEVEEVNYNPNWLTASRLILKTRDPATLEPVPGVELGRIDLRITRKSKRDARKIEKLVEYKTSEALAERSHERWIKAIEGDAAGAGETPEPEDQGAEEEPAGERE